MGYRTGILSEAHGGAMPNDSRNCPPGQGLLEPPARMRVCSSRSAVSRLFVTPWTVACKAPLSVDFPGKNTGLGYHFLLHHPAYLISMQSTSREMLDWKKHKLESRLLHIIKISIELKYIKKKEMFFSFPRKPVPQSLP